MQTILNIDLSTKNLKPIKKKGPEKQINSLFPEFHLKNPEIGLYEKF